MCRLFGFRSVQPSMVHRSLLETENALGIQSRQHPDGWGVAYYVDGVPHVMKSAEAAHDCHLFRRVSGVVSSESVIAHVRKATVGATSILNAHPFQHGRWVFAHNGDVPGFDRIRAGLLDQVAPELALRVLGETDSEVLFYLFLTRLAERVGLSDPVDAEPVAAALAETEQRVREVFEEEGAGDELLLNFMVTNGETLVASRSGRELYWSSYKTRCPDRDTCSMHAPVCEAPSATGRVHHLIVSSEPLGGENVWQEVPDGHVIGVDRNMRLFRRPLGARTSARPRLRVV